MPGLASSITQLDPQNAIGLATFIGLVMVVTATTLLYVRERRRWADREQALTAEIADLRGAVDRAELLIRSDRQIIVTWTGRHSEPRFEGDASVVGKGATFARSLAFGSWLHPADAAVLDGALAQLRERGEGFRLTLRTRVQGFIEAEGQTVSGQAVLRLRDITGDRFELLRCRHEFNGVKGELATLHGLLDSIVEPVWLRDAEGRVAWANQAYMTAVEAKDLDSVRSRSIELFSPTPVLRSRRPRRGAGR